MGCTEPLLAHHRTWLDRETGALESEVLVRGRYTDDRMAKWTAHAEAETAPLDGKPWRPVEWKILKLPCGKCLDCQSQRKLHWVHRCTLEASQHKQITFTTLTYAEAPRTLAVRDLQLFHKRLRKRIGKVHTPDGQPRRYRHFSCGEYGETHGRPHYHAILYGIGPEDYDAINEAWGHGFTRNEPAGPASIAYVAGYVNKKAELLTSTDPEWVNPFIVMSRGGRNGLGIGGHAKVWRKSWRKFAVLNGHQIAVPRYYHDHYKRTATTEELETLQAEQEEYRKNTPAETDAQRAQRALTTATRLEHTQTRRRDKGQL